MPAMPAETQFNTSFSKINPGMQLAVDSTSLGEFKLCPRKYYYSIICGYQPKETSVHLLFGIWLHSARELYDRSKFKGASHDEALDITLDFALRVTWNSDLRRGWVSDHKTKNRISLLRTIVWYLDQYGSRDALETVQLGNGQPAVELSFRFDAGIESKNGEPITLCGHLDRLAEMNGKVYIADIKTTSYNLTSDWFKQFSPHNQFSMYTLAGQIVWHQPVHELIVDGCQIGAGFTRFQRGTVPRSASQLEEWLGDTQFWIGRMEFAAEAESWPMNDKSCDAWGGCPFREVCSRVPEARQQWLDLNYKRRIWDPLQVRGDI